jgi:glycosyltransferase involved in cell wall biosynthesis
MAQRRSGQRIGIDARLYGPSGKGLGRYIQEITDRVVNLDQENQYIIFLSPQSVGDCQINQKNVEKVVMAERWYTLAEQLAWPRLIRRHQLDLLHVPHFNAPLICSCRLVITIHDLILTKFPSRRASTLSPILYWLKNLAYRLVISRAVKQAEVVLTVSEFTKRDIIEQLAVPAAKIVVTYNGVADFSNRRSDKNLPDKQVLLSYNIKQPYLLYVGNAYPHKNLEWLIRLFKIWSVTHQDFSLVLVGGHDYFYQRLAKLVANLWNSQTNAPVILPGFVPDEQLAVLYRSAALYIFPSRYEGFGLPALEAMSYGCPVVSSNSSCLPEILGQAAVYFTDNQIDSAIMAIDQLLNNPSQRQQIVQQGFEQIKLYSWETCAEQTLAIYRQLLRG